MDFSQVFELAIEYAKTQCSEIVFNLWINVVEPSHIVGSNVYLYFKDGQESKKDFIEQHHKHIFDKSFSNILGFDANVHLLSKKQPIEEQINNEPEEETKPENKYENIYEYTFRTFIVGQSNNYAHAAAFAVAQKPATLYNPLFIYGPSGLGKTHLLFAIKNSVENKNPNIKVLYIKGDDFTNELIEALSTGTTKNFRDKYRNIDILLVDDIHFIAGKERTQEEFFNTFNAIYPKGQIVVTSDRPPKEIKTLEERLRTRFESGLIADVSIPDFETRVAIIRRKAELLQINLPEDVIEFIAKKLKSNIRQLEGTVKKLKAFQSLANTPPSIPVAQRAINEILTDNKPLEVSVDKIITEVSRTFDVTPDDIKSDKRSSSISKARMVTMYILKEVLQLTQASIGENFSGRDHSTVTYALKQVVNKMEKDQHFKETVEDIIKNIREN